MSKSPPRAMIEPAIDVDALRRQRRAAVRDEDATSIALIAGSIGFVAGFLLSLVFGGPITENVRDVLVTGIGGLLGLMTGLTIAFLGSRNARQAERDRNKREDLYRFAADRQAAFARLLAAGDNARTATFAAANDPIKPNLTRASENVDQVTSAQDVAVLLGSERVNRAIDEYAESLVDYYNLMDEFAGLTPAGRQKGLEGTKWKKAEARVYDDREEALRLMREDLQIVPRRVIPRARRPGS